MNRRTLTDLLVFLVLVSLGIGLRLYFHFGNNIPNFAPVAGLALFAGYYFRNWVVALLVPLSVMTVCDYYIGHYEWVVMFTVYALLALPVAARGYLRKSFDLSTTSRAKAMKSWAGLLACSLGSSVVFYLGTNFAHWVAYSGGSGAMYPATLGGLAQSYAMAVPFLRNTLLGDMGFATLTFTIYALAVQWAMARGRSQAEDRSTEPALAA